MFYCDHCERDIGDDTQSRSIDGETHCAECVVNLRDQGVALNCPYCDDTFWEGNLQHNPREGFSVCDRCYNDAEMYTCESCEYPIDPNSLDFEDGLCGVCIESGRVISTQVRLRNFDPKTTKYISSDKGEIITSKRTFGVELELVNQEGNNLVKLSSNIDRTFGLDHDGSIKGSNPIEIVSPVLGGKKGESKLKTILKEVNALGFETNESCGLHVHLSGKGFRQSNPVSGYYLSDVDEKIFESSEIKSEVVISKTLLAELRTRSGMSADKVSSILIRNITRVGSVDFKELPFNFKIDRTIKAVSTVVTINEKKHPVLFLAYPTQKKKEEIENEKEKRKLKIDEIYKSSIRTDDYGDNYIDHKKYRELMKDEYGSDDSESIINFHVKPKDTDVFVVKYKDNSLRNTKTVLYLHTAFYEVFVSMLPKDRQQKNRFCQSLNEYFAPVDIDRVRTQEELEAMWYKETSLMEIENRKNGRKWDSSRYFGLNLHSLFTKNGTVEIRYHAGSTDEKNILYWTAFHQHILDKIVNKELTIDRLKEGAGLFILEDKLDYFLEVLQLPPAIERYVIARIDHFSKHNYKEK